MNRDALKELGLTEDQVEAVMKSHGLVFNPLKQDLETVTTDRDVLKGAIAVRDTQLEALGEVDAEGLKAQIELLKGENATEGARIQREMQEKLDAQAFGFALDTTITASGARNAKAIKALLDNEIIKLGEDGNLIGLSEQITNLKETDGYLFASDEGGTPPPASGYNPGSGQKTNPPGEVNSRQAGIDAFESLKAKGKI